MERVPESQHALTVDFQIQGVNVGRALRVNVNVVYGVKRRHQRLQVEHEIIAAHDRRNGIVASPLNQHIYILQHLASVPIDSHIVVYIRVIRTQVNVTDIVDLVAHRISIPGIPAL